MATRSNVSDPVVKMFLPKNKTPFDAVRMRHSPDTGQKTKASSRDLDSCSPSPSSVGYEERCNSSGNISKSTRALSDYVNNKSNYALMA